MLAFGVTVITTKDMKEDTSDSVDPNLVLDHSRFVSGCQQEKRTEVGPID